MLHLQAKHKVRQWCRLTARLFLTDQGQTPVFRLHVDIKWNTTRVTKGKINKQQSRYSTILHNIFRSRDHDSWNSVSFKMPGNQTHGLVANRSHRGKHRYVNFVFSAPAQHLRRINFQRTFLTIGGINTVAPRRKALQPAKRNLLL